ncbi:tetratricopeptide repeat protein [Undibacterium sp. TJN19]|uniref:tetratricopeptide repeat protein n=1 Tax=Undibacterium sp. TJN19 TaxID=3413055 RepID=UPI003BF089EC
MSMMMTSFFFLCLLVTLLASALPLRVLLLSHVDSVNGPAASTVPSKRLSPFQVSGLLVIALLASGLLYAFLGNVHAITQPQFDQDVKAVPTTPGIGQKQIIAMVDGLAARLQKQPDDIEGWRRLARSYETLRRFDLAVKAYQQLLRLRPDDADVLTDYAVSLAMSREQNLSGEPEQLLQRALVVKPGHIQALALLGSAAFERQDYLTAVSAWKKILVQVPPEDEMAISIAASISKAEKLAAQKTKSP